MASHFVGSEQSSYHETAPLGRLQQRTPRTPTRRHNRTGSGSSLTSIGSASSPVQDPRHLEPAGMSCNSGSFDGGRGLLWTDPATQHSMSPESRRNVRSTDLSRLDEVHEETEDGTMRPTNESPSTNKFNGTTLVAPTPPPRRASLSPPQENELQQRPSMDAQQRLEAERILGQAFGAPQPGTMGAASAVPGGDAQLDALFAPLRRSFSAPSVQHRSSAANLRDASLHNAHATPSRTQALGGTVSHHSSGLLNVKNSMSASRTSLANPRLSMEPAAARAPSMEGPGYHGRLRVGQRIAGGPSVESFTSCDPNNPAKATRLGNSFGTHVSPSMASSIHGSRTTRYDAGGWTIIDSAGLASDQYAQGDRLLLHRVTSEPTAGPMIRDFMESRVPTFAREPPHDMAEAVHRAGKILDEKRKSGVQASKGRDARFWLTFFAVFVTAFLSAVDLTIISPILPTIAQELPRSTISPTWITSAFLATSASFQPLFGGLSDAIGRRESLLLAILIFLVGTIVACIAKDMLEIVIGRGIQGLGGGGMLVVGEIIVSDMTTLAERGYFLGLLSIAFAVAALAAPIAGGWFATFDWRVAFYINFPVGVAAILMLLPAKLSKPKLSFKEKFQRTDIIGSLILFGSITSLLIGLTNGGVQSPWDSAEIVLPLACGGAGLVVFLVIEFVPNRFARYPILPAKLFKHRTAAIAYLLTFLHGVLLYGATQGLVLYFENRGASPLKAAVNILPANAPSTPAAFVAGIVMAITGKYKGQIIISEALMTIGLGLFIYLDNSSSVAEWAIFQLIASFGLGALYSLTLPPIQATVPAPELAHATATFAFSRSFGAVWGVSAFLIAFQVQAGQHLHKVPGAAQLGITGGTAIDFVPEILTLPAEVRGPLAEVFQQAIRVGFIVLTPFAAAGFFASLFIKHVPLPDFNDSKYGLEGQNITSAHRAASIKKTGEHSKQKGGFSTSKDPEKQLPSDSKTNTPGFTSGKAMSSAASSLGKGGSALTDASRSSGAPPSVTGPAMEPFAGAPLPTGNASWWSRRMSYEAGRTDSDSRRHHKLEKQRASLDQRRAQLAKKSLDLERQYELLQAEIDRNKPQHQQRALVSSYSSDDTPSPFPSQSSPRTFSTEHTCEQLRAHGLPVLPELSSGTIRAAGRPDTAESKAVSSVGSMSPAVL